MISCFDEPKKIDEEELHFPSEYSQGRATNENAFSKSMSHIIHI